RTSAPVRAGTHHCLMEWGSGAGPDGWGLAPRHLRGGPAGGIRPGQPRRRVRKDLCPVVLESHQVFERIDASLETGGDQTGEHTRNVRTVLRTVEERILALPHEQF